MQRIPFTVVRMAALLVTLALIPASVSALRDTLRQSQARSAAAEDRAARLAHIAAVRQRNVIGAVHDALKTIAGLSSIARTDAADCSAFFSRRLEGFSVPVRNLGLARPQGEVACSARAFPGPLPRQSVAADGATLLVPAGQAVAVIVSVRIADDNNNLQGALFAILDPAHITPGPPPGTALTLFDRSGQVATYSPQRREWARQAAAGKLLLQDIGGGKSRSTAKMAGPDGVRRRYAFETVGPGLYLAVGTPTEPLFAPARRLPYLQAAWLAGLVLGFILLAGIGGDRFLGRRLRMSAATAARAARRAASMLYRVSARPLSFFRRRHLAAEKKRGKDQTKMELRKANERLKHSVELLERRTRAMTALTEMGQLLQTCTNTGEIDGIVARFAQEIFSANAGALFTVGRDAVEAEAVWGPLGRQKTVFLPDECWALRLGRMHRVQGPGAGPHCTHVVDVPAGGYACIPLVAHGEITGILHLQSRSSLMGIAGEEQNRQGERHLVQAFSERVAQVLANLRFRETLRAQSIRDPLTGLYNRRFMEETLAIEERRTARSNSSIGIIMLDIDHFKRINDAAGHDAGDAVLRRVGDFLHEQVREGDIPCRYGGEEFTVILPGATPETTRQRAEAMRRCLAETPMEHQGKSLAPITASFGVACLPLHGSSWQAVLKAADAALYRAKHAGRNRVAVA